MTLPAEAGSNVAHPQLALLDFVRKKKASVEGELSERQEALAYAKKQKWQTTALARIVRQTKASVGYYEKVAAALEAGYVVMPPIDCEVFAVRIGDNASLPKDYTRKNPSSWHWPSGDIGAAQTDVPLLGEGGYVAPETKFKVTYFKQAITTNGKTEEVPFRTTSPREFISEIPFPLIVAKARLMDATQQAMALRAFDDIAISPSRGLRKADPIIMGRIHRRNRQPLCFMIAWYVNPEDI